MNRRQLLRRAALAIPMLGGWSQPLPGAGSALAAGRSRVRPSDPAWPPQAAWDRLGEAVGGRLVRVRSPLDACRSVPADMDCGRLFGRLKNPYYLGDEPGLTQTLGWVDAWTSRPSVYAVVAESAAAVAAAVDFARSHNLRLVVKGGGHSYQGTSNAPDSLLVWTRRMNAMALHDAFVGVGCAGRADPVPAVTIGAGAIWGQAYAAVTTAGGRYVQGGGCLTVGVAGLVQSGGFGSFSKAYGTAAAGLIEAEIVTADGAVRITNRCTEPDLFWAIKGGGGGTFGIVTRVTLRTHDLPEFVGAVFLTVRAASDAAFRRLIGHLVGFYRDHLFNPHWGEQVRLRPGNVLSVAMVFHGLDQPTAERTWRPFLDWLAAAPGDFTLAEPPTILAVPARRFWDPVFLASIPGVVLADDRPGAPEGNIFWAGNREEAGQILHGYQSAWLPAALLANDRREALADALFQASRHWSMSLHFNKGLAGGPAAAVAAARDTATNPAALGAFALAVAGAEGPPAYPGIAGHEPDLPVARRRAAAVARAMGEMRHLLSQAGSYLAEGDFFDPAWRQSFWGANYPRLLAVKDRYDPDGLFTVHHGVGSERWSADGFTRAG